MCIPQGIYTSRINEQDSISGIPDYSYDCVDQFSHVGLSATALHPTVNEEVCMNRNIALDILKLSMAFMVVGLHSSFLSDITTLGGYLISQGLFRIAVPVFLLINGFYFYYVVSKSSQLTWLKRVFILYVVWMTFYSYSWFYIPDFSLVGVGAFVMHLVIGHHHLWYVSGMIGAALLLITVHRFSSAFLVTSILLCFFVGVSIQYLGNYNYFEGSYWGDFMRLDWAHRNMLFFSYPFFCIGYLINKHSIHKKITFKSVGFLTCFGLFFLLGESYFNLNQENIDLSFDNLVSLLILCPFVFMLFMKLHVLGDSKNISLYSSAIYFIHPFILSILLHFTGFKATILTFAAILVSSLAAYFIIKINERVKFIL